MIVRYLDLLARFYYPRLFDYSTTPATYQHSGYMSLVFGTLVWSHS